MSFPTDEVLARAMFEEAHRHLEDARILHEAGRLPGAVTSSMKAAELGFKAALILDGAFGWWENVLTSHSPVTDASGHVVLRQSVARLTPEIVTVLREMERFSPARLGKKAFNNQEEDNPEYPYVLIQGTNVAIGKPSDYFVVPQNSRRYHEAARELLAEITSLYAIVGLWNAPPPAPLA